MNLRTDIALAIILAVFVAQALSLDFTQDDAYISYRYARNLVEGRGLVFNPGERVEGYTNFFWIILLSTVMRLGLDIITASKAMGVAAGGVTILLLHRISLLVLDRTSGSRGPIRQDHAGSPPDSKDTNTTRRWFVALVPSLLLAANSSFAYWSISGLETSLFVMMVLLSVYLFFVNQRLMTVCLAVASLIRPEGVLVFGLLLAYQAAAKRDSTKRTLGQLVGFLILLGPFLVFKMLYYGDLLPNPFYAKTGMSMEYLKTGLAYFWLFLRHYGLWGAIYALPLLLLRHVGFHGKVIMLLAYAYTLYVVVVGGDVLRGHRFFLPVVPLLYVLLSLTLDRLVSTLRSASLRGMILASVVAVVAFLTYMLPRDYILDVRRYEVGLNEKLTIYAENLRQSFGTEYSLAVSTIGVISYLTDAVVIDMLGLTDPYIARNPEQVPGMVSSWKEKRFNTRYLLSRDPDVIMFSTGLKPSAPAEKALFLSSKFRQNYYLYFFAAGGQVYKRKGDFHGTVEVFPDPAFVDLYIEALYLGAGQGEYQACILKLEKMLQVGPQDFARVYEYMGSCYFMLGNLQEARRYSQAAVDMDDYSVEAHMVLHDIYLKEGDREAARRERAKIRRYNPERLMTP